MYSLCLALVNSLLGSAACSTRYEPPPTSSHAKNGFSPNSPRTTPYYSLTQTKDVDPAVSLMNNTWMTVSAIWLTPTSTNACLKQMLKQPHTKSFWRSWNGLKDTRRKWMVPPSIVLWAPKHLAHLASFTSCTRSTRSNVKTPPGPHALSVLMLLATHTYLASG